MQWRIKSIQKKISEKLPEGLVTPEHNEEGHWYRVHEGDLPLYPSVTGKLQILKDEGIMNFKMNRALDYVFEKWGQFTNENIMEHLDFARRVSVDIFMDAGDIGTQIHDYREEFFRDWINTGRRPADILSYIPKEKEDVRAVSALRALDKFCTDYNYIPVATELLVYSHKMRTGGMLDDIGLMRRVKNEGDKGCVHEIMQHPNTSGRKPNLYQCIRCDYRYKLVFVLMDIKTSNQFKDHYFFQVALYYEMFYRLTGLKPDECFILKLSKKDGTYKIEDLKKPGLLASYAHSMIRTNEGLEKIKELRKDNQKNVEKLTLKKNG